MTALAEVGHYHRAFDVGIERLFENARDWEHLPHLHGANFRTLDLVAADRSGWRANVTLDDGQALAIDLRVDASGWVTRTEADGTLVSEIRTLAEAIGPERCQVSVSFTAGASARAKPRRAVMRAYARCMRDERMMVAAPPGQRRRTRKECDAK